MALSPYNPTNRQFIHAYGDGGFRISGQRWDGSVIVLPHETCNWAVRSMEALTAEGLAPVVAATPRVEVLLIGCGATIAFLPHALRQSLRAHGIVLEAMDTGAACRTYNVLLSEDRRVAAALIAV